MPLPGTKVIPEEWSRHHQPVATGGMNARCIVTDPARATPGEWDDEAGEYGPGTPFVLVPPQGHDDPDWPARIQALQSDQDTEQAGQGSTARSYLVQLDDPDLITLPDIEVGHVVEVAATTNDPHLIGLRLSITDVQHGSERFTRDVIAVHNQQTPSA